VRREGNVGPGATSELRGATRRQSERSSFLTPVLIVRASAAACRRMRPKASAGVRAMRRRQNRD
jgi:hypothetical protein